VTTYRYHLEQNYVTIQMALENKSLLKA